MLLQRSKNLQPDLVINAAGIIKQLATQENLIQTLSVNSIFPHRLAKLSASLGFRLITISTDCVFDGKEGGYTEIDESNANDLYGTSKYLGEVTSGKCLTIRTSIIGRELSASRSIVEWFLTHRNESVLGYTDAIYSGFPSFMLGKIISTFILPRPELCGLYHISSDPISKYELLRLIDRFFQANVEITPSSEVRVDRSLDSSKFKAATGFVPDTWENMIRQMAADPTPYDELRVRL